MGNCRKKKYKLRSFVFDCFMICITGGFWVIRIYVRESRNK